MGGHAGWCQERSPYPQGQQAGRLAGWVGRAGLSREAGFPSARVCVQKPATGSAQTDRHAGRWTRKRRDEQTAGFEPPSSQAWGSPVQRGPPPACPSPGARRCAATPGRGCWPAEHPREAFGSRVFWAGFRPRGSRLEQTVPGAAVGGWGGCGGRAARSLSAPWGQPGRRWDPGGVPLAR